MTPNPKAARVRRYGMLAVDAPARRRCHYGLLIWLLLTLAQVSTFFGTSSAATFVVEPIMASLHLSRSVLSLSYAVATGIGAVAQIPIGRLVDRFGGRVGVAACSAAFYLSLIGMALPRDWVALTLAFGAMRALGFGGLALACTTCLQQWFVRRRGLATGLSEAVNALVGFGLCSGLFSWEVGEDGYASAYVRTGAALMVYPPIALLLLRAKPEDIGLAPDGDPPTHAAGAGGAPAGAPVSGWTLREASRTMALWVVVVANALMWGVGAGVFFHLVSLVDELGLPPALLPSCFYLPWAMARAASLGLGGWALDHVEPRLVLLAGFTLAAASFLAFGWPGSALTPGRAVGISMAWGFSMGFSKATFAICPATFFGRRHLGSIQGLLQTTNVASTAIGPLLVGGAHDAIGAHSPTILAIAALYAFSGCAGALLLHPPRRREHAPGQIAVAECGAAPSEGDASSRVEDTREMAAA